MSSQAVKNWRQNTKRRMVQAMGGKCAICGYSRCHEGLQFHHLDPSEKDFSLGGVRASPKSWSCIVAELKKCVMLCSRCHTEVHVGVEAVPAAAPRFDTRWEDYRSLEVVSRPERKCAVCEHPITSRDSEKYCSARCASRARRRVEWDDIDLHGMLQTMSRCEVARRIGVSETAVRKRLKALACGEGLEPPVSFRSTD